MASKCIYSKLITKKNFLPKLSLYQIGNSFHTGPICYKVTSGRVKPTLRKTTPVTYERSLPPHHIAHRKSWNSWNTSTIEGGLRAPEILLDDVFIRKFITGTFPEMVESEIIIKRTHNIIRVAMILYPKLQPPKIAFLIGYAEELLSYWLQCIVQLEIQTIKDPKDVIFKYV